MIERDPHDEALVQRANAANQRAVAEAHSPAAVAKGIAAGATKLRNQGRREAPWPPFRGICEASGLPLDEKDKVLHEVEPAKGYSGKLQWLCPKHNNSGRRSCG